MDSGLQLLPKRPYPLKGNAFPKRTKFLTNHYRVSIKKTTELYQYSIDTEPSLPNDSIQILRDLVKSLRNELMNQIGLIAHKGKVLWGLKPNQKALILEGKKGNCLYEIIIKPTRTFKDFDIEKLQGKALKEVLQVYNVVLRQKIVNLGLTQIAKGRFIRLKQNLDECKILQDINLQVLRTYELRLVTLMKGISLQMDISSRALRHQNFLQTISGAKSKQEKQQYVGSFVECNYGNRKSYKIVKIDYSLSPLSTFYQSSSQEKITYQKYYFQKYGLKIKELKQPLIQVVLNVNYTIKQEKKEKNQIKGYLIPELVRLVGIPNNVKQNKTIMRSFDDFMHLPPAKRVQHVHKMIGQINSSKGDMNIESMMEVEGYILPNPLYYTSSQRQSEDGTLNLKDRLKEPMHLQKQKWLLVYSSLSQNEQQDDQNADQLLSRFREVQGVLGVTIDEPVYVVIQKDHIEQWKNQIGKNFKNDTVVVAFLTNRQSKYYGQLKRFLTNQLKVASQVVLRKTLRNKGLTTFSKIVCQINAKLGKALWSVSPQHPFWKNKTFAYGGISFSYGKEGCTLAFVGTFSHDMTKTYSYSRTKLPAKDPVSQKMYEQLLAEWLKRYQQFQKYLPSIIILYREGLSDEQVYVKGQKQLSGLFKVIQRAKAKFSDYDPQVVYIFANKRVNTRFYSDKSEGSRGKFQPKIDNPIPGSIVFQPLSTENAYDFHLVAHKVIQGTSTPTRYRIAYDASSIPQEAIAQFTNEQCYNYPNWFGSVRLPGCLQCADKLSKMIGEHIKENPVSSELLKTPFYL